MSVSAPNPWHPCCLVSRDIREAQSLWHRRPMPQQAAPRQSRLSIVTSLLLGEGIIAQTLINGTAHMTPKLGGTGERAPITVSENKLSEI